MNVNEAEIDAVSQRVVRYFRTRNNNFEVSNLGGASFVFDLDYVERKVKVRFSVCSLKDNFDKKLGVAVAENSTAEEFDLDAFRNKADMFGGFVRYYARYMETKPVSTRRENVMINFLKTAG